MAEQETTTVTVNRAGLFGSVAADEGATIEVSKDRAAKLVKLGHATLGGSAAPKRETAAKPKQNTAEASGGETTVTADAEVRDELVDETNDVDEPEVDETDVEEPETDEPEVDETESDVEDIDESVSLSDAGIEGRALELLNAAGLKTVGDVLGHDDLTEINGIGDATAASIFATLGVELSE